MRWTVILPFLLAGCFFPFGECGYDPNAAVWQQDGLYHAMQAGAHGDATLWSEPAAAGLPFSNATLMAAVPEANLSRVTWRTGDEPIRFDLLGGGSVTVVTMEPDSEVTADAARRFLAWVTAADERQREAWVQGLLANESISPSYGEVTHPENPEVYDVVQVDGHTYHVTIEGPYRLEAHWSDLDRVGTLETRLGGHHGGAGGIRASAGPWTFDFALPTKTLEDGGLRLRVDAAGNAEFEGWLDAEDDGAYQDAVAARLVQWGLPAPDGAEMDVWGSVC